MDMNDLDFDLVSTPNDSLFSTRLCLLPNSPPTSDLPRDQYPLATRTKRAGFPRIQTHIPGYNTFACACPGRGTRFQPGGILSIPCPLACREFLRRRKVRAPPNIRINSRS